MTVNVRVSHPADLKPNPGGWNSGAMTQSCIQCAHGQRLTEADARNAAEADGSGLLSAYYCPDSGAWHTILLRTPKHRGLP